MRQSFASILCLLASPILLAAAYPLHYGGSESHSLEARFIKVPAEVSYGIQKSKDLVKGLWMETISGKSLEQHIDAVYYNVLRASAASTKIVWKSAVDGHESAIRAVKMANEVLRRDLQQPGALSRAVAFAKVGAKAGDKDSLAWLQQLSKENKATFKIDEFADRLATPSWKKPAVLAGAAGAAGLGGVAVVIGTPDAAVIGVASSPADDAEVKPSESSEKL